MIYRMDADRIDVRHFGKALAPPFAEIFECLEIVRNVLDFLHDARGMNFRPAGVAAVISLAPAQDNFVFAVDRAAAFQRVAGGAVPRRRPCDTDRDQRQRSKDGLKNGTESSGEKIALAPFAAEGKCFDGGEHVPDARALELAMQHRHRESFRMLSSVIKHVIPPQLLLVRPDDPKPPVITTDDFGPGVIFPAVQPDHRAEIP